LIQSDIGYSKKGDEEKRYDERRGWSFLGNGKKRRKSGIENIEEEGGKIEYGVKEKEKKWY